MSSTWGPVIPNSPHLETITACILYPGHGSHSSQIERCPDTSDGARGEVGVNGADLNYCSRFKAFHRPTTQHWFAGLSFHVGVLQQ